MYASRRRRTGIWLVAPALVVLVAILAYPILASIVLAFTEVSPSPGGFELAWVGLDNYARMPEDAAFAIAFRNSIYFTVVEVVAVVGLSLLAALMLNHPAGRNGAFRVVLLVPWALAPVANAVLWKWIYNANYGILNAILLQLGVADEKVVWLGDPFLALNMILIADIWKAVPFIALLLLAGLQNIPSHLYRAARLDGAGAWQQFRFVTLPGLRTPILIAVVLQSIWALKVFDLIFVLTKGGPADGTVLLNFLAWRVTFNFLDFGYGAAIANVLFVFMFMLAIAYVRTLDPNRGRRAPVTA